MARLRTFKVLEWPDLPKGHPVSMEYDLLCECGREAICPVARGGVIEARLGMGFVTDPVNPPPPFFMPAKFKCRRCGRVYGDPGRAMARAIKDKEAINVR